jgi:hypothetical protein
VKIQKQANPRCSLIGGGKTRRPNAVVQHSNLEPATSALGQKRTFCTAIENLDWITLSARASIYAGDEPAVCFGGQGTDPKEQNTQQSPCFGRSRSPHPSHW